MSWIDLLDQKELKPIPDTAELVSDNGVSIVWKGNDGWYYKRSIPYLIQNELHFMNSFHLMAFVPRSELYDKYTIRTKEIVRGKITNAEKFKKSCSDFLFLLKATGIRHGDLTEPHVIIDEWNTLYIIDWAESRWREDPAPDKRPEGDKYWLNRTMKKMLKEKKNE